MKGDGSLAPSDSIFRCLDRFAEVFPEFASAATRAFERLRKHEHLGATVHTNGDLMIRMCSGQPDKATAKRDLWGHVPLALRRLERRACPQPGQVLIIHDDVGTHICRRRHRG